MTGGKIRKGAARSSVREAIPFILEGDHSMMAYLDSDGKKKGRCLAQIACALAKESGATELVLVDHDIAHMTDSDSKLGFKKTFVMGCDFKLKSSRQTTIELIGHLQPKASNVRPFRYTVTSRAKINTFEPKKLDPGYDLMTARYSQIGVGFIGNFHKLACAPASLCKVLWEAKVFCGWPKVCLALS